MNKDGQEYGGQLLNPGSPQAQFKWIDKCKDDVYWPPCNGKCPLIPNKLEKVICERVL